VPEVQILSASSMGSADGAYSRKTRSIYISADCPLDQIEAVLLEEIGHHIDALFNEQETPGDEGTLFSAAVRGITLSDEEITAILNEDDSAILSLDGRQVAVECAAKPAPPPRAPLKPIVTVSPVSTKLTNTSDWETLSSGTATLSSGKHGLSLVGAQDLGGYGNSGAGGTNAGTNTLSAASNSGNSVLYAGTAATTMIGGSGNTTLYGSTANQKDSIIGGTGSSTIIAGNGLATLVGGAKNNSIMSGTAPGRTLGQSLEGGKSTNSLYGNTLRGGAGRDTLRSGVGFSTLISGSNTGVSTTINAVAATGVTSISVANASGLAVGQQITGNGIASGTTITSIAGTQLTLSAKTTAPLSAGSRINTVGNILIGQGLSNSLRAGSGNDSLIANKGNSTLLGGVGLSTLQGGDSLSNNWLQSVSTSTGGNSLVGGAGFNTLVAGLGKDTLIGGSGKNLLLVNRDNLAAFARDNITLSTLASASNTLGISATSPVTINDSLLGTMAGAGVTNLGTVANLGSSSTRIILGANAQKVLVNTLVAGIGSDTLSVAGFTTNSALLDASKSVNRVSLVGGGTGNDTFLGSKGGYDTMTGAAGNDSFVIQASALAGSSFGRINGNGGNDTLQLNAAASLAGTNFNGVQNIENLILGNGNNRIGSLQGSGIQRIVGNTGSDTLSANVYGTVRSVTRAGSNAITLNVSPGTSPKMGFDVGQVVTGNGIALGTTITSYSTLAAAGATPGTVTLTLSTPTTSLISQGGAITGWLNGATLDGSSALGFAPTEAEKSRARTAFQNAASAITAANYGQPNELEKDTLAISTLKSDPSTFIHRKGDFLTSYGQNNLLIGGQGKGLPQLDLGGGNFNDKSSGYTFGVDFYTPDSSFKQHQVVDNTLVSGAFDSNTLIGGSGENLYLINNLPGAAAIPRIQNPTSLQSASTIQFTGNGVILNDTALSSVSTKAAQKIVTANGNNLIEIGLNASQIGIQTIIGGVGSDTFVTGIQLGEAVPVTLMTDAFLGDSVIYVNDTSELSIGSLVTGDGIAESTSISSIDLETGAITLSKGITQDLPVDSTLSGTPLSTYVPSVYFDASRGSGNQSLASGNGNDTLITGTGNATISGGDGNNSLRGGAGNNLILSGVGNSTLDGGFGISTLQADGGVNRFIVRNRNTRILNPYDLERDPVTGEIAKPNPPPIATTPEIGIVDTYINFDPILGSPVSQFDPGTPDDSPSITKSPSFASSDLSSFYNLQYFNLLGAANYGVGNALDNTMSAAAANALILGMGGNNTLVASGSGSSLYGNSNANYASPDLYAYAPIDTRTQAFVDGVMGVAGNNSLISTGANSFLDGGSGYDDGLFNGSGTNTLVGTGGNSTVLVSHQADFVSLTRSSNTVITSVDLYQAPDNVSDLILNVTPQLANSGQVSFAGQRMTAGYAAMGDAKGGYTDTNSVLVGGSPALTVNQSARIQVAYGISDGTVYGSENVPDANISLNVGTFIPDPKNPGKQAVTLDWTPLTPDNKPVGQTMGYVVNYQLVASNSLILSDDALFGDEVITVQNLDITRIHAGQKVSGIGIIDGTTIISVDQENNKVMLSQALTQDITTADSLTAFTETPYLTYLKGTSRDLNGTSLNPSLQVDNLFTSFTDPYGNNDQDITYDSSNSTITYNFKVTAQETVLPAYTDTDGNLIAKPVSLIGGEGNDVLYGGLLNNVGTSISNTRPVLTNNPINPLDPRFIATPVPWDPTATYSGLFPTYLSGGLIGDDLLIAPRINNGSGTDFTAYQYINGVPTAVTYSGLNTLEGGQGSDTFVVYNGGGGNIDTTNGMVTTNSYDHIIKYGSETPADQHNLVVSMVRNLTLSDTVVDQGKFIDQVWAARESGGQYIGGNRLDNSLTGYGPGNTLLGAGGRDLITGSGVLIGGTAYGLDNIAKALENYAAGQSASIYRDTDPVPVLPNGPGSSDNSQYWMVNGNYDPLRNSDTLVGGDILGSTLDGGAGNDSMVGSIKNDTLLVSNGVSASTNVISGSDIVIGGGGNDWILFTGSDTYWSGRLDATTAKLGYALSNNGDAAGGQSISNIKLQDGSPVAMSATGNATSTGNQTNSNLGEQLGSNQIVGNEYDNTLNGGGVGGTNGTGVGVDTLTGEGGADRFVVGSQYRSSASNVEATNTPTTPTPEGALTYVLDKNRTDGDYAILDGFSDDDKIQLSGSQSGYFIGEAPTSFGEYNIGRGPAISSTSQEFGIYAVTSSGPNLVAHVKLDGGLRLGGGLTTAIVGSTPVDGANSTLIDPNHLGGNLFSITSPNDETTDGFNYLGVGRMYNLEGSNFSRFVS
jgi:Ca2+-binding RTX toxin-like protein